MNEMWGFGQVVDESGKSKTLTWTENDELGRARRNLPRREAVDKAGLPVLGAGSYASK